MAPGVGKQVWLHRHELYCFFLSGGIDGGVLNWRHQAIYLGRPFIRGAFEVL